MTNELDALIIRSLPELEAANQRCEEFGQVIYKELDREIEAWVERNGWRGSYEFWTSSTWLAPPEWNSDNEEEQFHLYFKMIKDDGDATGIQSDLARLLGIGGGRVGLTLRTDSLGVGPFKRLWKPELAKLDGVPVNKDGFFLPLELDREALATAVLANDFSEAMEPLRGTLDSLPQLASQLEPLKQMIVAAGTADA